MSRWLKCTSMHFNTDWNKYDDRLMRAVERNEVDKVTAVLSKKGIIPTKLDVEGRSAFHLAATRGHLDCLGLILGHSVDVTAADATGKNVLHLASRNGHSQCVQKLLQHNCPVGNVDLQGRTALHDAVMAGCSSSVKLLCDSGASVNAADFDGRTPLMLATQMCHPHICQLLLERGADISIRDKLNKSALILGCEFSCKDAVEVLLKSSADVKVVDSLGHDAFHYARLSKNQELVAMVKSYLDKANREKEAARIEQWKRQHSVELEAAEANRKEQLIHDLERQNETLQENLRKYHQDQRALLDKVNVLQQQLSQEKTAAQDSQKEKDQLKALLTSKEREEGTRGPETVKVQLRSTLGDYSGQSVIKGKESILVKQAHSLDCDQMLQNPALSRSLSRPLDKSPATRWDVSGELEALRHELEAVKRQQQSGEEEIARLQSALNRKSRECQELVQSRDAIQKQADQQVQELEDALGDVQKRMLDSECKVKQLQAHVVAVKEHLGGQATEELRAQLQDVKAKYEGASNEVGRVRNRLKQSEKALEEYKSSESQLASETERLNQELGAVTAERDELAETLVEMDNRLKELQAKHSDKVPAEKFDNMKNLLTNAVDEKERQLAELRDDYDRVLEEVAELHQRLDGPSGATAAEEQHRIQAALEEQNASLKRKLMDVTTKSQALINEVRESEEERDALRDQLDKLKSSVETDFMPRKDHEETRRNMVIAVEELEDKLVEASERYGKAEAQVQQLQMERATMQQTISSLTAATEGHKREMEAMMSQNTHMTSTLELLQRKCEDREREFAQLSAQSQTLKQSLDAEYVPRKQHEQVKLELSSALETLQAEMLKMEKKEKQSGEEVKNVKEGNEKLKKELENVLLEMKRDYMSIKDHEAVRDKCNAAVLEAQNRAKEESTKYQLAQEETVKLTQELEAQRKELDTIQEAIQSRFIPLTAAKQKEQAHTEQVKELTAKLLDMEDKYNTERSVAEGSKLERDQLKRNLESLQQRLDTTGEKHHEVKEEFEALGQRLAEVTLQKVQLQEQNALSCNQLQSLQERLKSELTRIATYDAELQALHDALQQAQADCKKAREAQQEEAQRGAALHKELQLQRQQQLHTEEALEAELARLHMQLRREEESSAQRAEDVSALHSELLQATQALQDTRYNQDQMNQLTKDKQQLQEAAASLSSQLLSLTDACQAAQQQAAQARDGERRARGEVEAAQEKGRGIEREVRELKERYEQSLSTICDLQRRIQTSAQQTEAKDKKITELLTDVERLKQALNGLSQLAYTSNTPNKRQTQQMEALQAQIRSLQQQLADAERQHREVVSIYRTHLLSAAQGHMDEDVQAALLQIIRMRQEFVC
ncbi:uveal autoantigen with coiled-coil domains and ankyrin repeats protein isoform X2 [Betta splendens]|uniref:Uveal autoantigen with coiled-coil domains and ankyrin repeats protein isoform X2 n=1 Tax=Betta splendens TaxID=158456 RepID=A0A6P7M300_BETSP|nr:uveal autoantigen with coiled-coil domains and ankyrin repeats protein isoform X2 [Betta splendens]